MFSAQKPAARGEYVEATGMRQTGNWRDARWRGCAEARREEGVMRWTSKKMTRARVLQQVPDYGALIDEHAAAARLGHGTTT